MTRCHPQPLRVNQAPNAALGRIRASGWIVVLLLTWAIASPTAAATAPSPDTPPKLNPAELRDEARQILEREEFRHRSLPQPLRGPLRWIGEQLDHLYRPLVRLLEPIIGAGAVPWTLLGIAGLATTLLAIRFAQSRSRAEVIRKTRGDLLVDPSRDPRQLDSEADRAEASGDFETAIRLRHEAGLIRLVRDGRLDLRPETTARGAAHAVGDPILHELTDLFEAVVYGDHVATESEVRTVPEAWRQVLDERDRARSMSGRRASTGEEKPGRVEHHDGGHPSTDSPTEPA